jgi:isocitrate dehydrogenase
MGSFGDLYCATDYLAPELQLVFMPEGGGKPVMEDVYDFEGKGVALAMYNTDDDVCPFPLFLFVGTLLRSTRG